MEAATNIGRSGAVAAARLFGGTGRGGLRVLGDAGRFALFCAAAFARVFRPPWRFVLVVAAIDLVGAHREARAIDGIQIAYAPEGGLRVLLSMAAL